MSTEAGSDFSQLADPYRSELLAHCYRMLGSVHDAEDLVQETLLRAWRGYDRFDGRSSLRTWLYRIATNACLTALQSKQRRVLPSGLGAAAHEPGTIDLDRADAVPWLSPIPTTALQGDDPAGIVALRDSTRLALIAAFQRLPPRQRAVLLLVEVVGLGVPEAAQFLEISYPAARSLLQRARSTVARLASDPDEDEDDGVPRAADAALLDRYLKAFERADTRALAALLRADADYEMPPHRMWFRGIPAILDHHERRVWPRMRRGLPTSANGYPAIATYVGDGQQALQLHGIQVLESAGGLVSRVVVFLDPSLAPVFGVPSQLQVR